MGAGGRHPLVGTGGWVPYDERSTMADDELRTHLISHAYECLDILMPQGFGSILVSNLLVQRSRAAEGTCGFGRSRGQARRSALKGMVAIPGPSRPPPSHPVGPGGTRSVAATV